MSGVDAVAAAVHGSTSLWLASEVFCSGRANTYVLTSLCRWGVVLTYCVASVGDVDIGALTT